MNLQDTVLRGEEIIIGDSSTFNAIGPDVLLEECTIRCRVPADCLSVAGKLVRSLVVVESRFTGFSWLDARIVDCTFQGWFSENEFGTVSNANGCCESCVFRDANLEDCIFYGESCESHAFPKWPNFVILHPHKNSVEMQNCSKIDSIADVVGSIEFLDGEADAIAYNSRSLAKRLRVKVEDVQGFFSQFPFVRM